MCGICGMAVSASSARTIEETRLRAMSDTLTHRGPDDAGIYISGKAGLAHRRLSIIDLGGGHQPMANEDETVHIVYNGEVYNHAELRPDLEKRGHIYRSLSDTETIIHLYEEYGARAVERLRGMFAFAIWDQARQTLLLARDRLGIKPLYYSLSDDGTIFFASEIKALVEAGAVKPEINYNTLSDYLANRYTSGEETLFRGVKRLLPGHTLIWHNGHAKIEQYWELSFRKSERPLTGSRYAEQFAEMFDTSVRLRLMADVPLGMFLSGGIDSSAIAAAMSRMVNDPIKTFSVAFAEREANELEYARIVAREFKTDHHEVVVSPEEFFDALPRLVYQEDEPIAHPSSVALYFVSRLAAGHVKVVLTGEGSDELLAGYGKYSRALYNLKLGRAYRVFTPAAFRRAVARRVEGAGARSWPGRKLKRTFLCLEPEIEDIYFDNFSVFSRRAQQRLLTTAARERMPGIDPYRTAIDYINASDAPSFLDQMLAADMKTYLHELLMKQDQMSMAASIESRVPFLDHKLVEFAASLPTSMKLRGLQTKYILRRAMKGKLPAQVLSRKKMGFPVPVGKWLRSDFTHIIDEYVLSERARERGIFDHGYASELAARHKAGEDHTERLWALINFEIWQRRFFDNERACAADFEPPGQRLIA
ncbi:MAG TPA: asparagine synthase (glutamine-hydrolyzing) [Blastocatellia bacterium]|jgi:asparagine synthase (glutamine-hydrolysing)